MADKSVNPGIDPDLVATVGPQPPSVAQVFNWAAAALENSPFAAGRQYSTARLAQFGDDVRADRHRPHRSGQPAHINAARQYR
ncbi:hypothetical protein [Kutzneria sp. 744]|uniref:hypothetical protein n=1 Tax=Kutzneria sp. (strain 744) TaxID=345341 RepID=UPI0004AF68D0|nr:hypothetical protein [Kutzneria sp. 744]